MFIQRCRQFSSAVLIIFFIALAANSQTKPVSKPTPEIIEEQTEVLRVETDLVTVPTNVFDRAGRPLTDLQAANFIVYENGKRQEISTFGKASAPFEIALLLDTSGSTRADLRLIQNAAAAFINNLREGDKVSIIAFNGRIKNGQKEAFAEILNTATNDREILSKSLGRVGTSSGTPFYDSLMEILEKIFAQKPANEFVGRRAIVALTDGVDSTSDFDFEDVRDEMTSRGAAFYFVSVDTQQFFEENLLGNCSADTVRFSQAQLNRYYKKVVKNSRIERKRFCEMGDFERLAVSKRLYELARTEMKILAETSGGKVFPVESLREARSAFQQIANELGTQYSIGYYSTNEKKDGTFRQIRVETKGISGGAKVSAREGYTANKN